MIEMAAKKKLFLIAGHGEGDPGACSIWGQEANYTRELAKLVKTAIGSRMSVTLYDTNKNCYAQSKRGNVPAYSDYDMTVEIHFNAKAKADPNGDGRFTGVGGYIHPNNAGRSIARAIVDRVVALGFREWLLDTSTGLLNLNRAQGQGAKYFLLETAFIDDGDDMKFYTARKEIFAQAIAQGILDGLGVKSTATQPKAEQYYRVRLTKDDEKSQLFAGTKAGALAVCKTKPGYSVFDPDMKCIYTNNAKGLQASALKGLSEKEWIEKVGPLYTADEKTSGILACVSLAQGILESGYGQTDLAQSGNNLHGMKTNLSGNTWPGTTWDGSSKYTRTGCKRQPVHEEVGLPPLRLYRGIHCRSLRVPSERGQRQETEIRRAGRREGLQEGSPDHQGWRIRDGHQVRLQTGEHHRKMEPDQVQRLRLWLHTEAIRGGRRMESSVPDQYDL